MYCYSCVVFPPYERRAKLTFSLQLTVLHNFVLTGFHLLLTGMVSGEVLGPRGREEKGDCELS